MFSNKIVSRYVEILFSFADHESMIVDIQNLNIELLNNNIAQALLESKSFPKAMKYEYIDNFFKNIKCLENTKEFLYFLIDYNRIHYLNSIVTEYKKIFSRRNGKEIVYMKSSKDITLEEKIMLEDVLSKKIGFDVTLEYTIDKNIILGAIFLWDDKLLDVSINHLIQQIL